MADGVPRRPGGGFCVGEALNGRMGLTKKAWQLSLLLLLVALVTWALARWLPLWGQRWPGLALACSSGLAVLTLGLTLSRPLSPHTLALGTVASVLVSPHVKSHHLVISMVLAWSWLLDRQPLLASLGYLTSLTPLLRLGGDQGINWLDFLFPITLMLALLLFFREQRLAEDDKDASAAAVQVDRRALGRRAVRIMLATSSE